MRLPLLDKEIHIERLACRDIANNGENTDDSYTQWSKSQHDLLLGLDLFKDWLAISDADSWCHVCPVAWPRGGRGGGPGEILTSQKTCSGYYSTKTCVDLLPIKFSFRFISGSIPRVSKSYNFIPIKLAQYSRPATTYAITHEHCRHDVEVSYHRRQSQC